MRNRRTALAYLIGVGCGFAYIYTLTQIFGRVLVPNPFNQWLIDKLARTGHEIAYKLVIYTHDFLIYIILAVPFAVVLSRLPPKNNWKYLLVALGTSLVIQYWVPITDPSRLARIAEHWQFYVGLGMSVFALPLAFALVIALFKNRASVPADAATTA